MTNEEMVYYLEHSDITVGQKCKTKTAEAIEKALKIIKSQTPESTEKLKKVCGEVFVFMAGASIIGYMNKETGEKAEFVSKRKLNEAISKLEELRKYGNSFAECADECIEILRDAMK